MAESVHFYTMYSDIPLRTRLRTIHPLLPNRGSASYVPFRFLLVYAM